MNRLHALRPAFQLPLAALVGIIIIIIANGFGLWWMPALVGCALGVALVGWRAVLAAWLAGLAGWGLDLLWQALHEDIGGAAAVVAGILGLGTGNGAIVLIAALVLASLLSLAGVWVGTALRRMVHAFAPALAAPAAALGTPAR